MSGREPDRDHEEDMTPSLVVRLRAGDPDASQILDALYRPRLVRFCRGYLGSCDEADDVVQDAFCRVLQSAVVPDRFRPWLYKIARNRCLDVLRGRARRRDDQSMPSELPLSRELTGNLTRLVRRELHARLHQLVAALPASQREILRLRYGENLSRAEIAEVLSIPESLVKSRLFEGLERLRQHSSLSGGV